MNNSIPKIMVVDDEINNRKLIEAYLAPYNVEVISAASGIQAVELCRTNPGVVLILMDILMRDMNGFETAEKILNIRKDIVIIYQTAYADDFLKDELMKSLLCGYIAKPISKETLITELGKYVNITKKEDPCIVEKEARLKLHSFFSILFT